LKNEIKSKDKQLKLLRLTCFKQKLKIKALNEKQRRSSKKLEKFENIIEHLKKQRSLDSDGLQILSQCSSINKDFLNRQIKRVSGEPLERKYSAELRTFALTLNFWSCKAYTYIRKTFNTCLPHPRTLSKWYQKIDAEPGFTKESFSILKSKCNNSNHKILCTLVIDEMSIRKGLKWDASSKKYYGFIDTGTEIETDALPHATESLVFFINKSKWIVEIAGRLLFN